MGGVLILLVIVVAIVLVSGASEGRRRTRELLHHFKHLEVRLAELALQLQGIDLRLIDLERRQDERAERRSPSPLPEPTPPSPTAEPREVRSDSLHGSAERLGSTPPPPSSPRPPHQQGSVRAPQAPEPERSPSRRPAVRRPPLPPAPLPLAPPPPAPAEPSALQLLWRRIERLFIENWTGILGVLVVVAGVTFVVINVALRLGPFQRFWMTVAAAAALAAPSFVLGDRLPWRNLTHWMRSGGAALFLFACAAGGGLPGLGLQWLQDPRRGLALLSLGVVVNLALAGVARTQTIASLHVVLGLVPLMIVLDNQPALAAETLVIASLVAVVGLILPLRRPWDPHLLVVTLAYAAFHGAWFLRCAEALQASGDLRLRAALAALLVFGGGALLQHRRLLSRSEGSAASLAPLPLALQLSNWGALALALLIYPQQAVSRAGALALAALVAALLARRARQGQLGWLQLNETLIAQSLAMGAVISLHPLIANGPLLLMVLLVETLLFLRLGIAEKDTTIRRLGWGLVNLIALLLVLAGVEAGASGGAPALLWQNGGVLIGASALLTAVQRQLSLRRVTLPLPALLGWLAGALAFVGAMVCPPEPSRELLALVVVGALLLAGRCWRPAGVLAGATAAAVAAHGVGWSHRLQLLAPSSHGGVTLYAQGWSAPTYLPHLLPLTGLALLALAMRRETVVSGIGWALFNGTGVVLIIGTVLSTATQGGPGGLALNGGVLVAWAAFTTLVQLLMRRFAVRQPLPPLMGGLSAVLVFVAAGLCTPEGGRELEGLLAIGGLLLIARRWRPEALMGSLAAAAVALHVLSWGAQLQQLPWSPLPLLGHLLPLTTLALLLLAMKREPLVSAVGWALLNGTAVVLILGALVGAALEKTASWPETASGPALAGLLVAWAGFTTLVQVLMPRFDLRQPLTALMGWISPALVLTAVVVGTPAAGRELEALLALGALLLIARCLRPDGLLVGTAVAVALTHAVALGALLPEQPWATAPLLGHLLPLTALALVTIGSGGPGAVRLLGLDLLGLDLGLAAYLLFEPISPLIPGVVWLLLSLVALESSDRLRRSMANHALVLGLLYLLAFAGSYLLVISQSPALVSAGPFTLPIRLLIELLALAVALYWWFFSPRERLREQPLWQAVHPWFLEVVLVGVVVTILGQVEALWRPVAWSLLALVLVSDPCRRLFATRVKVYAVILYWVAVATVVAMLSSLETPSPLWYEQPHQLALVAIGLQMTFIVVSHRNLDLQELRQPGGGPLLAWVGRRVAAHRNHWLYYPMFAAVAYYLYLRYDPSLHTLLWAVEAFALYVLSALLQENSFRTIALVGLGICLLRLMSIDLAQVDLGLRGIVFIGVGLLMLAMNAIYNRFRARFE
ncbi:hypothetical protein [Cyanobium sp. Morenito 9A2]|uniref:hypothetical protein n=1 Tax=Cyanobium sp. Morenito 9A2 TaxID=2823718 RepID=UPI0020CD23CA|nr:hypothetical protein [Cyanobium sp. Morenito 9A2]MCP9848394.1 hypothetical protein [Cyanobium sp. Morenito 9A2]